MRLSSQHGHIFLLYQTKRTFYLNCMEIILSFKSKNVYNAPINTDNIICVLVYKTAYNPKIV